MPSITQTLTLSIAGHDTEINAEIEYSYYCGQRGARDSLGGIRGAGAPLEPDEPAHCEIESATLLIGGGMGTGITRYLSDDQISALADACLEQHEGD